MKCNKTVMEDDMRVGKIVQLTTTPQAKGYLWSNEEKHDRAALLASQIWNYVWNENWSKNLTRKGAIKHIAKMIEREL